jgi:predicted enzyme related to lactoylglutathione lyase
MKAEVPATAPLRNRRGGRKLTRYVSKEAVMAGGAGVCEPGYFTISVETLDKAMDFYGALFGWEFESEADAIYAHVANTEFPFGLVEDGAQDAGNIYFRVEDIDFMVDRVYDLGGSAGEVQESDSGLSAVCLDDQGTRFSLWQPAEGY